MTPLAKIELFIADSALALTSQSVSVDKRLGEELLKFTVYRSNTMQDKRYQFFRAQGAGR